jgi:hypothetical protein
MPKATDPQFLYMILILPTLFGLTLVGEGLNKILKSEMQGWMSIFFGVIFIGLVGFAYWFFSQGAITGGPGGGVVIPPTITPIPTMIPPLGF